TALRPRVLERIKLDIFLGISPPAVTAEPFFTSERLGKEPKHYRATGAILADTDAAIVLAAEGDVHGLVEQASSRVGRLIIRHRPAADIGARSPRGGCYRSGHHGHRQAQ